MLKETGGNVKRDLRTCQKRSVCGEKALYICNEMCKRDLQRCQKRPMCVERDLYICNEPCKRDL